MKRLALVVILTSQLIGSAAAQFASETPAPDTQNKGSQTKAKSSQAKHQTNSSHGQALPPPSVATKQLFDAVWGDNYDSAEFLLQQGADINCRNCANGYESKTILQACAGNSYTASSKVVWLVNHGADVGQKDNHGNTALHYSIFGNPSRLDTVSSYIEWPNTLDRIRFLLGKGLSPNDANDNGDTPLHILARQWKSRYDQYAPPSLSVQNYGSIVRDFIDGGADINKQNRQGQTPIMLASRQCNIETLKLYASLGANLKVKDVAGKTITELAREFAIQNPTKQCIEIATALSNGSLQSTAADLPKANNSYAATNSGGTVSKSSGGVPDALVGNFHGYVTSSLNPNQKIPTKGVIQSSGEFRYEGSNGVLINGRFDTSGSNIQGTGRTRLPNVGGRQYTYPNGEAESDAKMSGSFNGQVFSGDFSSKFETGTFYLCTQSANDPSCNALANPLGDIIKGIGGLFQKAK